MQSKHPPNAAQQDFHDWIRDNFDACMFCGYSASEIHHIIGSAGKHFGIWIGQWLVGPICYDCNHNNLKTPPKREQIDVFVKNILQPYYKRFGEIPMSKDELLAIVCWSY